MDGSFSSLPPRDAHALWYRSADGSATNPEGQPPNRGFNSQLLAGTDVITQYQASSIGVGWGNHATVTQFSRLRSEEVFIHRRMQTIQDFGSTWIRPPGVSKTLQLMRDETAEREEHEAALQEAMADAINFEGGEVTADGEGGVLPGPMGGPAATPMPADDPMEGVERDLDDDVPEAEDVSMGDDEEDSDDDDDDDADEGPTQSTRSFGQHHNIQQQNVPRASAVPTPTYSTTPELVLQRPSDDEHDPEDNIPDADSYQHTDTDVEDSDSDDGLPEPSSGMRSFTSRTPRRGAGRATVATPISSARRETAVRNATRYSGGSPPPTSESAASTNILDNFVARSPSERGSSRFGNGRVLGRGQRARGRGGVERGRGRGRARGVEN